MQNKSHLQKPSSSSQPRHPSICRKGFSALLPIHLTSRFLLVACTKYLYGTPSRNSLSCDTIKIKKIPKLMIFSRAVQLLSDQGMNANHRTPGLHVVQISSPSSSVQEPPGLLNHAPKGALFPTTVLCAHIHSPTPALCARAGLPIPPLHCMSAPFPAPCAMHGPGLTLSSPG